MVNWCSGIFTGGRGRGGLAPQDLANFQRKKDGVGPDVDNANGGSSSSVHSLETGRLGVTFGFLAGSGSIFEMGGS